jgi:CheY-like chemotaxis protein
MGDRHRVLVVDDYADCAEMFSEVVMSLGHDVRSTGDGASALVLARSFKPHLVMLDIGLPDMDGYEVCKLLRKFKRRMRIVAVSGYKLSDIGEFDLAFLKPVCVPEIRQALALVDRR